VTLTSDLPAPTVATFGHLADGRPVELIHMRNSTGMTVELVSYGALIKQISVPDHDGKLANVVLGFDNLDDYVERSPYFGATIGRFANRIAGGRFTLDGIQYQLPANEPPHTLHGGRQGFDKQLWEAHTATDTAGQAVYLRHVSPDGAEGFPGNLAVTVTFRLHHDQNILRVDYHATTDRPTIVNLTNHSFFNLGGEGSGSIMGHTLQLNASRYLPLDKDLLPTGALASVAGTPMDFTTPHPIGERVRVATDQLLRGQGYDHNYVLDRDSSDGLAFAARVIDPVTRRSLEVWTTEPGIDFYTGNFLDGSIAGPSRRAYRQGDGFAIEPEHFSDSPNRPAFPTTVLRPGGVFTSRTDYRFGVATG
jgi:aldose 1-epimerase